MPIWLVVLEREHWNGTGGMERGEVVVPASCVLKEVIFEARPGEFELLVAAGSPRMG